MKTEVDPNKKLEWWEWLMLAVSTLSLIVMLSACTTIKYVPVEKEIVKTITITERDTLIKVEEDQASLQALLSCDSLNQVLIEQINTKNSYRTSIDISVNENNGKTQLLVDCKSDSLELEIKLRDKLIEDIQNSKEVVVIPASLNSYQKTMICIGWSFIAVVIGYILYKIIRWYIKIKG